MNQTVGRFECSGNSTSAPCFGRACINQRFRYGEVGFGEMASKDEIIAAASRLFVEKGFENTTMRDIAETVGIFKGSLYHHIKSKADLFYEILEMSLRESSKPIREVRDSNLQPEKKLREIVRVHFENVFNFSLEYQIVLNERRHMLDEKQEERIRALLKAYENCVMEVLEEGVSAEVFRDDLNPRVVVAAIMGAGNAIYKWFSPTGPLSFQAIAEIYVELFVSGLRRQE